MPIWCGSGLTLPDEFPVDALPGTVRPEVDQIVLLMSVETGDRVMKALFDIVIGVTRIVAR